MTRWQRFAGAVLSLVLAGGLLLSASSPSLAQRPTEEQILNALKPAPKTRGLTTETSRQIADEQRFVVCHRDDDASWYDQLQPVNAYDNQYFDDELIHFAG